MFVCPSNAGTIFGVDPLARRVAWAYRYETAAEPEAEDGKAPIDFLTEHWKVTAPAIADGAVVFTAPDSAALECLELSTGKPRWRAPRRTGDLYLAGVFHGLALVVNRDHCRALKLEDGSEAWKLEKTGMPSGQGVAAAGIYYLPLAAGAESKEPEVLAIHIAKGTVARRIAKDKNGGKTDVPGNLIFANGQVFSQTVDGICAYPLVME
jgi:outer membrane protein assembly factor BamB